MKQKKGGPLQRTGVHMTKEAGEALKKSNDSTKALLDSIRASTAPSADEETVDAYSASAGM